MSKAREFISPSDLTFSWNGCHRCLWLNYNHGVKAPSFFPLVGELSAMQEKHFNGAKSKDLHPEIKPGKVLDRGGWVKSMPITYNSNPSPYAIRGKYDLLMEFEDGTYGVVDCKFQGKNNDKSDFYSPQLEAYAYALENPEKGKAFPVSTMGLLVWKLNGITETTDGSHGFGIIERYVPVMRNQGEFNTLISDLIGVIEGEFPDAGKDCDTCNYLAKRLTLEAL